MKDFDDQSEELLEDAVIVMVDEDGNEEYYVEEEIITIGDKRFAVLIPVDADGEYDGFDEDGETGVEDAVIAKIIAGEDGEDSYCDPTDEEFEEVMMIYKERDEEEYDEEND
ncbi:MAG: DUF1292 domain-containing protein [Acidaminococcales bacterium]|jgi:uncharacterized protein YrzB (UPF0473 family)|nr:DUF1292 domain-containing protein [Acidaminococcales bacterium]